MATRKGLIKRLSLSAIANVRRAGLIVMNLKDGDDLVSATLCNQEDDVVMVTRNGQSIRFPANEITPHQRGAGGIKGIALRGADRVVAMDVVVPEGRLLVVSRNGYGKLTQLRFYRAQKRGGIGLKTFSINQENRSSCRSPDRRRRARGVCSLTKGPGPTHQHVGDFQHRARDTGSPGLQAGVRRQRVFHYCRRPWHPGANNGGGQASSRRVNVTVDLRRGKA